MTFENKISKNCEDLIKKLLLKDNNSTIKIKEIFSNPWVLSFEKDYIDEETKTDNFNVKNNDNTSTNHNSSSSIKSVKEFSKNIQNVNYIQHNLS